MPTKAATNIHFVQKYSYRADTRMNDRPIHRGEQGTHEGGESEFPLPGDNAPFEPQRLQGFEEVGADIHMRDVVEDDCRIKLDKAACS